MFIGFLCTFLLAQPILTITTIHYDKPNQETSTKIEKEPKLNQNLTVSERQKRLLPYENFYQVHGFNQPGEQRYQFDGTKKPQTQPQYHHTKYTPFLESNAIPGPFTPMLNPPPRVKIQYIRVPSPASPQEEKLPNFSAIYDKLSQLKLRQNTRRPTYVPRFYATRKPQNQYIQVYEDQREYKPQTDFKPVSQPTKTFVETYSPTNIDIPPQSYQESEYQQQTTEKYQPVIQIPYRQDRPKLIAKPIVVLSPKPEISDEGRRELEPKPIIFIRRPVYKKPLPIVEEKYQAEKFLPVKYQQSPVKFITVPVTPPPEYYEPQTPRQYSTPFPPSENEVGSLSLILKQLQETNTLPQTLTADNIDNSIKTLVRILGALKQQKKLVKPIVVPEEVDYGTGPESQVDISLVKDAPGTVTQSFPADTQEGGTPGKPGIDYPALATIPQTSFSCKSQRYKGFFGDPDTNCQVWHYCDLNGGQASFLCPNGTIFSQVALTCDWWYNVKCSSTPQLYVLNERLYKYIIPLAPKFPEDYSGPLVDKYLALKFQEMEEKMRKEKKGKQNSENESEELQNIEEKPEDETTSISTIEETTIIQSHEEK